MTGTFPVVPTIRIVLAEDNLLVREGLSSLIAGVDGLELIGTGSTYDELVEAV